ncbi:MAG: MarR family transcriptional regulator [Dehalococcoidia bacterium]|nr:MarR family transcriptional regulator [Dehalococcoidia bacterium]
MDYNELAVELHSEIRALHAVKLLESFNEAEQGEAFVLQFITHKNRVVLPGEIRQKMKVSSARIAQILNSLESKGLITRRIDEKDRRNILVTITQEGSDLVKRIKCQLVQRAADLLEMLGEKDAREYVRITSKLVELASIRRETE